MRFRLVGRANKPKCVWGSGGESGAHQPSGIEPWMTLPPYSPEKPWQFGDPIPLRYQSIMMGPEESSR